MNQFISKGKSVEDAINRGLQIMKISKDEVNIEIIQYETEGFIGIGKKQAIVKLTKHTEETGDDDATKSAPPLDELIKDTINDSFEEEEEDSTSLKNDVWQKSRH